MDFLTITWDINQGLELGPLTIRWYSLLFALGFIVGFQIMLRYFKQEGIPEKMLDKMLVYTVVATVIGARLGHVFFYGWDYYQNNLSEIFMVWKGGLASHGAAVGLIISMWLLAAKFTPYFASISNGKRALWLLDRLVITVALAGCFIRLGNMMNSEIYGKIANSSDETVFVEVVEDRLESRDNPNSVGNVIAQTELTPTERRVETDTISYPIYLLSITPDPSLAPSAFSNLDLRIRQNINNRSIDELNAIYPNDADFAYNEATGNYEVEVMGVPRLPTQIYESIGYLIIFIILFVLFRNPSLRYRNGFIFGAFLVLVFGFRFGVENLKAAQEAFEHGRALNQGQVLSIPLVAIGLFFLLRRDEVKPTSIPDESR